MSIKLQKLFKKGAKLLSFSLIIILFMSATPPKKDKGYSLKQLNKKFTPSEIYNESVRKGIIQSTEFKFDSITMLPPPAILSPQERIKFDNTPDSLIIKKVFTIYGVDDRKNPHQVNDVMEFYNASITCCIAPLDSLKYNPESDTYTLKIIHKLTGICPWDKFFDEPRIDMVCSGFAISDSVIITVKHAIEQRRAENLCVIYGYRMIDDEVSITTIPARFVYPAKIAFISTEETDDLAILKLDRSVGMLKVCKVRRSGEIDNHDMLYMAGYPCCLPLKITENGYIYNNYPTRITCNLDKFAGNSGSPVFNKRTHKVEGILIGNRGRDYRENQPSGCRPPDLRQQWEPIDPVNIFKISRILEIMDSLNLSY